MPPTYYVYVSYRRGRARIHRADCGFCKHGKGARGRESPSGSSSWIGPYLTLKGARTRLEQDALWLRENSLRGRELRDVQLCGRCRPGERLSFQERRYFVYENRQERRARIHHAACGYCQDGQGHQGKELGRRTITMRWHGPFRTVEQAWRRAQRTGYEDVRLHGCASWRD